MHEHSGEVGAVKAWIQRQRGLSDARVALRIDRVGVTAFVNNLGNSRGVTTATTPPLEQFVLRPRTYGVTLDYRL